MRYYFAYGSNLHPIRLEERLGQVKFQGTGALQSAELLFNKVGSDGSGKATIRSTYDPSKFVLGAVYNISKQQEKLLDGFESLGKGYHKIFVEIKMENEETISCFTYKGMPEYVDYNTLPFHWYKQLVVQGARFMDFPQKYIHFIENVDSVPDQNEKRVEVNERLIKLMQKKKPL